jgi:hypothetical protein
MTPRALAILLGVTAISAAGALGLLAFQTAGTRGPTAGFPATANLVERARDIARLRIEAPSYTLNLERRGATWVVSNMADYPIQASTASGVVAGLAALRPLEAKTNRPERYGRIQVEEPGTAGAKSILVTVETAQGEALARLIVGKRSASTGFSPLGGTFVRRPGDGQAWLAAGSVTIPESIENWLDSVIHVPGTAVKRVAVLEGDDVVLTAAKAEPPSVRFEIDAIAPRYEKPDHRANDRAIKGLALGIVSVTAQDIRAASAVPVGPGARTVRFELENSIVLDATVIEGEGGPWVRYRVNAQPSSGEGATLAQDFRAKTANWAFKIAAHKINALKTSVEDLIEMVEPEDDAPAGDGGPRMLTPEEMQRLLQRGMGQR